MTIRTEQIVSVAEVNKNFSKATRIAEKNGTAVIFQNNKPKFVLVDLQTNPIIELTDDEKIDIVAKRILEKYRRAFEVLAQ